MYKNKNFFIVFFFLLFSVSTVLFVDQATSAGLQYTLLEKIPGFASTDGSDLPKYIIAIYNVGLAVVTLSAVLMISIGGFMYLTSAGNTSSMGTAKGIIFDALIGLVIAFSSWVLLNVINPDLVNVSINGLSATPVSPGVAREVTAPSAITGGLTDAEARAQLSSAGISVNSPEPTTSLGNIPASTITHIIQLKNASGCSDFRVTGGTEPGHVSHGAGLPIVDVTNSPCLKNFLTNKGNLAGVHITKICAIASEQAVAFNCGYKEPAPHFHIVFTP